MANEQNLKPVRTKDEARERGKKGGVASGKARRERKMLKDELLALLSDGDTQEKMCLALIRQAQRGNIRAFEVVRDTVGEKPIESKERPLADDRDDDNLFKAIREAVTNDEV